MTVFSYLQIHDPINLLGEVRDNPHLLNSNKTL